MAGKRKLCCECEKPIKKDEKALSMKLLGTDTEDYYCLDCLAEYLECSIEDLKIKIQVCKEVKQEMYFRIWLF